MPGDALSDLVAAIRTRTPARILVGRAGPSYRTSTQLELRRDHAAAIDAVHAEVDLERDFGNEFIQHWGLLEVVTRAQNKTDYLMRPDLGRRLSEPAREEIARQCPKGVDLQIAIGDGLSAAAVVAQVPHLLPRIDHEARSRGWTLGKPFLIHYCRVGVLNDIGDVLDPQVVVLLIGERPGLATAESLSAYMAFRPRPGHTDAQRNLISNIHARGVSSEEAAGRIVALAETMCQRQASGVAVKERMEGKEEIALTWPAAPTPPTLPP
jgi:ethanolamine ammonia-lyase small subunit